MCTSIFTKTADNKHILSRTMDFSVPIDPNPVFIPRNYTWESSADQVKHQMKNGFIGAGKFLGKSYFVADGVNEHGLSIAELYLPGEVQYQAAAETGKVNLAPHEFILWVLGNFSSIAEMKKELSKVNIVSAPVPVLDITTPLHWIITDDKGTCVVIEPTEKTLHIKENPVGVMTNTPQLEWHIENLRNYLDVRPKQYEPSKFGEYTAVPFSQGTGTSGLPGGFTPPERFVRAAFFKEYIEQAKDEETGVINAYHILNTVRIPRGTVVTDKGADDYSLYVGSMCNESRTYYFSSYDNYEITRVVLDDELLAKTEPIVFTYKKDQPVFVDLTAN